LSGESGDRIFPDLVRVRLAGLQIGRSGSCRLKLELADSAAPPPPRRPRKTGMFPATISIQVFDYDYDNRFADSDNVPHGYLLLATV